MATRPLIKESLRLLNPIGVDPNTYNVWSNLRLAVSVIFISAVCIDSMFDLIFNWQGINSMESIVVFASYFQVITKMSILVAHRGNLAEVFNKMNQFWSINKYGPELQKEIETVYTFAGKSMKAVLVCLTVGTTAVFMLSIFVTTKRLPFKLYHPTDLNRSPDYEMAFGFEIVAEFIACCCLIGFDFLFVSLIINTTCELKIIKKGLGNLPINHNIRGDTEESLRELYKIMDHHSLVLDCIKSIRGVYSFWLLNILFYNIIDVCGAMLCMITTGVPLNVQSFSKYGFVIIFYMTQLFFYCVTGQYLITETESVSAAVYDTDWWIKTQPELRKALVLIIQRANKAEHLTAGGMFALNLPSFTSVNKSAFSFFTLVNAVYRNN